jgi:hypothetical protein
MRVGRTRGAGRLLGPTGGISLWMRYSEKNGFTLRSVQMKARKAYMYARAVSSGVGFFLSMASRMRLGDGYVNDGMKYNK